MMPINKGNRDDASKTGTLPRIYSFAPHTARSFAIGGSVHAVRFGSSACDETKNDDGPGKYEEQGERRSSEHEFEMVTAHDSATTYRPRSA
jgi:hypothetical protein